MTDQCEEEVIPTASSWGAHRANPTHQCRNRAKFIHESGGKKTLLCGIHANTQDPGGAASFAEALRAAMYTTL